MNTHRRKKWRLEQFGTKKIIDIDTSGNSTVGRNADASVCLRSNKSSRQHATFVVNVEGNLMVQDLKSINGTFVNGSQIAVYVLHRVFPGDVVSFGLGHIDLAADDRDRHLFFTVLQVEECLVNEGNLADSTSDLRKSSLTDSTDTVEPSVVEVKQDSIDIVDIMEISSSTPESDNEQDNLPKLKIMNVFSIPGSDKTEPPKKDKRHSLAKELPPRISNRRRTVDATVNENISHKISEPSKHKAGPSRLSSENSKKAGRNKNNISSGSKETETSVRKSKGEASKAKRSAEMSKESTSTKKNNKTESSFNSSISKKTQEVQQAKGNDKNNQEEIPNQIETRKRGGAKKVTEDNLDDMLLEINSVLGGTTRNTHESEINLKEKVNTSKEVVTKIDDLNKKDKYISNKSFTINQDNSVVIEIPEDNDDMDVSCSQIFMLSNIVKTESADDTYRKIKEELAEMDFCNDEVILNQVPVDLDTDFDSSGFENTQEICELLQDGVSEINETVDEIKTNTLKPGSSGVNSKRKPQIVAPHTMTKPVKKLRQSPRTKLLKKEKSAKRKTSTESPIENKKCRKNSKSPINPMNYAPKEILLELRRRNSTSNELDRNTKACIKEERRKKLKNLSANSSNASISLSDSYLEKNIYHDVEIVETILKDKEDEVELRTAHVGNGSCEKITLGEKKSENENSADSSSKLVPVDVAPVPNYNLRRAKSSDEIKVRGKNYSILSEIRAPSRHSTCTDASITPLDIPPTHPKAPPEVLRVHSDPRLKAPPAYAQTCPRQPAIKQHQSKGFSSNDNRRKPAGGLMWNRGGPVRKQPPRKLPNVDDITNKMVQWLPNWLQEQMYIDSSAPVNNPPATKIPLNFKEFHEYYETFSKLVLLENWQYLFKGFRESIEQPRKVRIENVRVSNKVMYLDCVCYISQNELRQGHFYRQEDFLLLEYVINDQDNNCYMSCNFGLIQNCRKSTISNDTLISTKRDLCPGDPHTKLDFTVLTRYQPGRQINIRKMPIVKTLANVRSHLMLIKAIKVLEYSPLCGMILNPKMSDYKFPTTHTALIHPYGLNSQQKMIVLEAASLCTGNKHGIYCVKGPPGTGKSTVIVNLLFQILFSHWLNKRAGGKQPMILLAAPSNTAVDNLISKLMVIKQTLTPELKHQIKLVRIGPESSISKEVIGYSLPRLAEKHVPIKNMDHPKIRVAKERNENMIEFCKRFFGDQYAQELKMCENLIINKSNIICTTLNSCINGRLIDSVNRGFIEFTCCIIDEVTQCHEVEALLPTILGIDKLVLVGDPQQLNATIMNKDAHTLGFEQSLFTRLTNNFKSDPRTPIRMLRDQYRMHPEICSFPNKHFYEGKLRSFANPVNKLPEKIQPYLVFNLEKSNDPTDYTNTGEVVFIRKLLSTIFSMVTNRKEKYTVGIITPYNAQKDLICSQIGDLIAENENFKITTNTVDSFQGSENDIIIISCVRDSSNMFLQNVNRLNVALTRAKQILYIIGNYTLFKECKTLYELREDAKKRKVLLDFRQDPKSINNLSKFLLKRPNKTTK